MTEMNVLVTGAAGYIGGTVTEQLLWEGLLPWITSGRGTGKRLPLRLPSLRLTWLTHRHWIWSFDITQ